MSKIINNNGKFIGDNNKDGSSNRGTVNNKFINNNTKIINKGKNKEKKNRNILPPQEKPTVENGGFKNIIDSNFTNLRKKPEIDDVSFIRPNLELLCDSGKSLEMFAYVSAHRKDKKYVLYNLCSETMFLSDHVIVKRDESDELFTKIGQCIRFIGTPYRYGDKVSVTVSDIKDLGTCQPPELNFNDKDVDEDDIEDVFSFIEEMDPIKKYELIKYLVTRIEGYSLQLFRNKRFILSMICDFYFMRTINNELSTNKFFNKLDTTKERFIMIFSDILYGIEKGQLLSFKSIQYRILTICLMIQGLPEKNIDKIYNKEFDSFIEDYFIKESHAIQYIKNIYKWYEIDDIKYINPYTLNREMRYATASIILNS
jgi:hypothetical protein